MIIPHFKSADEVYLELYYYKISYLYDIAYWCLYSFMTDQVYVCVDQLVFVCTYFFRKLLPWIVRTSIVGVYVTRTRIMDDRLCVSADFFFGKNLLSEFSIFRQVSKATGDSFCPFSNDQKPAIGKLADNRTELSNTSGAG